MTAFLTGTKMALAYDNHINPAEVTAIQLTGVTDNPLAPAANLKYDDPWRMFVVTATPTANVDIEVTIATGAQINCCGIINHTLATNGYTVEVSR